MLPDYWSYWHGGGRLLRRRAARAPRGSARRGPRASHPAVRLETRIVAVEVAGDSTSRRSTCPTAARTSTPRCGSSRALARGPPMLHAQRPRARPVRRPQRRPRRHRRPPEGAQARAIGQLPEERELVRAPARRRLVDVGRASSTPTTTRCSPGGRRGATCASATSAGASTTCWRAAALGRARPALHRLPRGRHERPRTAGRRHRLTRGGGRHSVPPYQRRTNPAVARV